MVHGSKFIVSAIKLSTQFDKGVNQHAEMYWMFYFELLSARNKKTTYSFLAIFADIGKN
jgi:hypothetical protein